MISIVVPVYNVEKYLDKCIQSIIKQTYRDFELILVDDGSMDNSGKICDKYALQDNRIRVIHKKNSGLSDARNIGTKVATGEKITYIDSDDFVDTKYLEMLMMLQKKYNSDISVIGIHSISEKNMKIDTVKENYKEYLYSSYEALKHALYQDTMGTSACATLIPAKIAKNYSFPKGKYHEDDFTTYKYYMAVDSVAVSENPFYFYIQRKKSITHNEFGKADIDELEAADNFLKEFDEKESELYSAALSKAFSNYCQVILKTKNLKVTNPEIYKKIKCFFQENATKIIKNKNCRQKNRIVAIMFIIGGIPMIKAIYTIRKLFERIIKI